MRDHARETPARPFFLYVAFTAPHWPVQAPAADVEAHAGRYRRFFRSMLEQGVYLAPSPFECAFVSLAHRRADLDATLAAAEVAMLRCARVR